MREALAARQARPLACNTGRSDTRAPRRNRQNKRQAKQQRKQQGAAAAASGNRGSQGITGFSMVTDDAAGIKLDPKTVLVLALLFVGAVVLLHIQAKIRGV